MTTPSLSDRRLKIATVDAALHFDELARLAELAASYWSSIALAADRGEHVTVAVHAHQVVAVTREAVAIVNALRADERGEPTAA